MKPKRLVLDTKKLEQPGDTYPYGKNGVWNANIGAMENENGFLLSNVQTPYPIIGFIETDTYPVYFSTNNTNSAIGFHNTDTDLYVPIIDDASQSFLLDFNINRPIKGEYRRNFQNEIELVWIELGASANPPRWLNTVIPGTSLNDFLLFPKTLIPFITTTLQSGGNLGMGAYFFAMQYINNDGTVTGYTTLTSPLIAFSDDYTSIPGSNTGKAINIQLTGIDQTFNRIGLVVVELINGVYTPYSLPDLPVAFTVSFIYTGAEKGTQLTMDEVLTPSAYYENAQAITQLLDQLFLANMTEETIIDWQQYASMVQIRWKSEIVNVAARPVIATESGKQRGFMHEEVYAFYMVLKLRNGRSSRAFTIPGPVPLSSDLLQSSAATAQGITATVYQIEDTTRNLQSDNTGNCGIWINENELYPDIPQFDSTTIGGENLRNQPVRHHKMPSVRFCKTNLYGSNADYARTQLDTLGLEVSNVIIPANLQSQVIGWELHYAQRDFNNATVLGQSLLMFGAQANQDVAGGGNITSTGGNWGSWQRTNTHGATTDLESLNLTNNYIRFHAFDLLFFRPSITPTHLSVQVGMTSDFTSGRNTAISNQNEVIYDLDYTNGSSNISVPIPRSTTDYIYAVTDGQYIITDSNTGDWSNIRLEGAFVGKLTTPNSSLMSASKWSWAKRDYKNALNNNPISEQTYLANLMLVRQNVYLNYFSQALVRTGVVFPSTLQASTSTIYGGDTFLSVYTFITYGLVTRKDIVTNTGVANWQTGPTDGIKTNHRFICETVGDVACRYQTPGNAYSAFWPQSSMAGGTNSFLYGFSRDNDPNQIGYISDCNAVGSQLNGILIASPYDQFVQQSPTKIVRSQKQISESVINSWKNFAALDYFEAVKNKGPIINLQGMNTELLIHHQNALYVTRSKATFQGDVTEVTLGTGDIFQFDPNELRPAKLGYGGTENPLACVLTPVGYIFPDNQTGELFLYDSRGLNNIGSGLINFLLKYLTVKAINSYIGNGISIGFDPFYKRILLTVKNINVSSNSLVFVPNFQATPEFFATLTPNVSVVYKDGRYQLYKGTNSSIYNCSSTQYPSLGNYNFSSNEHVPNGTVIGTVAATGGILPYSYIITSSATSGLGINPLTGIISVINTSLFDYTLSPLSLIIQVTDANGNTDTGGVTVTINRVASTPTLPAYNVSIPENSTNGSNVNLEVGSNRDEGTLSYSILSGNSSGAFAINSGTGQVTVNDHTQLNYFGTNPFILTIQVATTASGNVGNNTLTVALTYVHQPPIVTNDTFSISSGASNGAVVGSLTPATQRAGQSGTIQYSLLTDSTPAGTFVIDVDPDSITFLQVTVVDSTLLNPADSPYILTVQAVDPSYPADTSNFTATITVFPPYQNVEKSRTLTKTCTTGQTGTSSNYIVPAGTYFSNVSQADADAQAVADVIANGQDYANLHGTCLLNTTIGILSVDYYTDTTVDLCAFVTTAGTSELSQIVASTANGGPLQLPDDGTPIADCWTVASDKLAGPPVRRFELNLAYFIAKYPLINVHTFVMQGRATSAGTSSGVYALRNIVRGVMTMNVFSSGPPILYIPSVTDPTPDSIISWSSHTIAGADGTVGTGVGSPILLFTYTVSTNTLTVTTY